MAAFNENMFLAGDGIIRDVRNGLTLRIDLHKLWDDREFTFVPKAGRFVLHVLSQQNEAYRLYHNNEWHRGTRSCRFILFSLRLVHLSGTEPANQHLYPCLRPCNEDSR